MIKCYIVDDEAHIIHLLSDYIHKTPGLELIGSEENPLAALHAITGEIVCPDVVFADVDMPELSGIDLAGLIRPYTEVVFATAYPDYALQAFDKNAIDYLVKPVSYERFLQSISRIKARSLSKKVSPPEDEEPFFYVKSDMKGKMVKVEYDEIIFIEGLQNYVKIHTQREPIVTHLTLKKLQESLPEKKFSRIHKSFIVNNSRIRVIEGNQITLEDKRTIVIGTSYRESFLRNINKKLLQGSSLS